MHLVPSPQQNYFSVEEKKKKERKEGKREGVRERRASELGREGEGCTCRTRT